MANDVLGALAGTAGSGDVSRIPPSADPTSSASPNPAPIKALARDSWRDK
ncbi:hypothetical protein [Corynebacterium timonense]|nr:hypothetical protein [Corynebacterium timonense]